MAKVDGEIDFKQFIPFINIEMHYHKNSPNALK
jgi:hypothetical protein